MMQVDVGQLLDLVAELIAQFLNDELKDLLHKIQIVHENLQQVLNFDFLVGLETEFGEITLKRLLVFGVINECPRDLFDDSQDSLRLVLSIKSSFLVVDVALHQFWDVLLEALHLFLKIIDLFVDDVQGRHVVMPVLNFDLNQ